MTITILLNICDICFYLYKNMNVLDGKILRTTGKWRVLYDIMAASKCSDVIAL